MRNSSGKNESGSSRMDTVLKMLLIAFISLLAFSSGVYFGKQLSDSDYQLRALESDFTHSGFAKVTDDEEPADYLASNENTAPSRPAEEAISPDEVAALSEELVNSEKANMANKNEGAKVEESRSVASAEAANETAHVDAKSKPDLSAASKAAQRIAQNAAPVEAAPQKEPSRIPTSLPKTVGTSQDVEFTVQVASYPTSQAAREHADDLIKKGFPAFPVEATVQGKTWYRVSVGSFKTQKEATMYRAQLLKQTSLPSAIVQKIRR